jgi:hypothetical protein
MKDFESTPEQLLETAAERDAFYWRGQRLEPFSFLRQAAAQRIVQEGSSEIEDSVLLVYLCTLPASEIDAARGKAKIAEFRAKMAEWCDREGVTVADYGDILKLAAEIFQEVEASRSRPEKTKGPTETPPKNE